MNRNKKSNKTSVIPEKSVILNQKGGNNVLPHDELASKLKYALKLRNKKAAYVGNNLNIPRCSMSAYLNGKSRPTDARLASIAKLLKINLEWFYGNTEEIDDASSEEVNPIYRKLLKLNEDQIKVIEKLIDALLEEEL